MVQGICGCIWVGWRYLTFRTYQDLDWRITEFPIPLVYLDEERSFGGALDETAVRLEHYRDVLNAELSRRGMTPRFTADCGQSAD